jgi:hypothetical protein
MIPAFSAIGMESLSRPKTVNYRPDGSGRDLYILYDYFILINNEKLKKWRVTLKPE